MTRVVRKQYRFTEEEDIVLRDLSARWKCSDSEVVRRAVMSFSTNDHHLVLVRLDEYDLRVAQTLATRWNTDIGGAVLKGFHGLNVMMEAGLANLVDIRKLDRAVKQVGNFR